MDSEGEREWGECSTARRCISIRSDVNFDKRTHIIIVIISNIPHPYGEGSGEGHL